MNERNWDLVREILEKDDVFRHMGIMLDAGILKNGIVSGGLDGKFSNWSMWGVFISMQGHDLLDALRDKTVWMRVLQKARQLAVSVSWEFIKASVPVVMNELLNPR